MRHCWKVSWVLLVACACAVMAAPALAHSHRCGRVYVPARGLSAKVRVVRGSASCAAAKRLVRAAYRAEVARKPDGMDPTFGMFWRVQGWKCLTGLAESQVFCDRGANRVDGSLRRDDGWTF